MSNIGSASHPDTRGRPRSKEIYKIVERLRKAFEGDKLPKSIRTEDPPKLAARLYASRDFKELENDKEVRFRILKGQDAVVICLRKDI